eukprot:m.28024 g.28024  ORF g.28024 m.28024 type:complete len:277 (+) comp30529_c0_seq3:77-907(+)
MTSTSSIQDDESLVDPSQRPPSRSNSALDPKIDWWNILIRPSLTEFFGTTIFVFVGILASLSPEAKPPNSPVINAAFSHGLAIAALAAALGPISGGHMNPAVTLGVFCSGVMAPAVAAAYMVAQLGGSLVGALLTMGFISDSIIDSANETHWPLTLNSPSTTAGQALGIEIFLTCFLVVVVLMMDVENDGKNNTAPLFVGFTVAAGILASGNKSGASFNPARSFGPAVVYGIWTNMYVYFVGPFVGAIAASLVYRFMLTKKKLHVPFYSSFIERKK